MRDNISLGRHFAHQGNGLMVADLPSFVIRNFQEPSVFWLTDRTMLTGPQKTTGWPPFAHAHVYRSTCVEVIVFALYGLTNDPGVEWLSSNSPRFPAAGGLGKIVGFVGLIPAGKG